MPPTAPVNTAFEGTHTLANHVWHAWLWGSDPEEACIPSVLLNLNQLMGLLVSRFKYAQSMSTSSGRACGLDRRMTLMDKPVDQMSWTELKDTVSNVQLEWAPFVTRSDKVQVGACAPSNHHRLELTWGTRAGACAPSTEEGAADAGHAGRWTWCWGSWRAARAGWDRSAWGPGRPSA